MKPCNKHNLIDLFLSQEITIAIIEPKNKIFSKTKLLFNTYSIYKVYLPTTTCTATSAAKSDSSRIKTTPICYFSLTINLSTTKMINLIV